jgi:hypothetical protein
MVLHSEAQSTATHNRDSTILILHRPIGTHDQIPVITTIVSTIKKKSTLNKRRVTEGRTGKRQLTLYDALL